MWEEQVAPIYFIYVCCVLALGVAIFVLSQKRATREEGPTFLVNELPSKIMERTTNAEPILNPLELEINELNAAIAQIRAERSRMRALAKKETREMTPEEEAAFKALMGRTKAELKKLNSQKVLDEQTDQNG